MNSEFKVLLTISVQAHSVCFHNVGHQELSSRKLMTKLNQTYIQSSREPYGAKDTLVDPILHSIFTMEQEEALKLLKMTWESGEYSCGGVIDLPHLAITTLSYCNSPINPPSWNGWAGDLVSAYSLVQSYHDANSDESLEEIARAYVGGEHPEEDLRHSPSSTINNCNYSDLCSDGYAILLAKKIKEKKTLAESFKSVFENEAGMEFKELLDDIGANDEIPLIKNSVTKVVKGIVTNLLYMEDNGFRGSDEDVKEACINAFAYWIHSKQ